MNQEAIDAARWWVEQRRRQGRPVDAVVAEVKAVREGWKKTELQVAQEARLAHSRREGREGAHWGPKSGNWPGRNGN